MKIHGISAAIPKYKIDNETRNTIAKFLRIARSTMPLKWFFKPAFERNIAAEIVAQNVLERALRSLM